MRASCKIASAPSGAAADSGFQTLSWDSIQWFCWLMYSKADLGPPSCSNQSSSVAKHTPMLLTKTILAASQNAYLEVSHPPLVDEHPRGSIVRPLILGAPQVLVGDRRLHSDLVLYCDFNSQSNSTENV